MYRAHGVRDGYTIVETMIFLAVSGALFVSAMLLVGGQQRRTEFNTTVRDFDSKLQSVISNVVNGYYNNTGETFCDLSGAGGAPNPTASGGNAGTNGDCTFIGQWIELALSGDKFTITSYAGLRRTGNPPHEVTGLAEAQPTPITTTAEDYNLLSGVKASMKIVGGSSIQTLAITTTFNLYNGAGGTLGSGSTRSEVHAITAANVDTVNPPSGVQICLSDGGQVGVIVLNTGSTTTTIGNSCP